MGKRKSIQQALLGNLDSCMQSNEIRTTLTTCTKIKWLKDLNIRQDTIKLLEDNIGKTLSDINLMNIFSGQSPKATEIRAKINQWDLFKIRSFAQQRKPFLKNEKTTYRTGENSCKRCNRQGFISKIHKQLI